MDIKRIYLIGFMGSGKSTLGRWLINETGWRFIDLDDRFETKYQTTISHYFELVGEDGFRKAEQEVLQETAKEDFAIIATGGGTPCFYNNMEVMNDSGLTLYLKLSPEGLVQRLKSARQVRPLVAGKSGDELLQFIKKKLTERAPYYEKSNIIVDAEVLSVQAYVQILKVSGVNFK